MTKILKMEKKLLVLSNATPPNGSEHENTLVNFKTRIPQNFLDSHKKWAMSVESFGCHFRPKNPILPKNSAIPSLIQISMADFNKGIIRYNLQEMEDLTNLPSFTNLPNSSSFDFLLFSKSPNIVGNPITSGAGVYIHLCTCVHR